MLFLGHNWDPLYPNQDHTRFFSRVYKICWNLLLIWQLMISHIDSVSNYYVGWFLQEKNLVAISHHEDSSLSSNLDCDRILRHPRITLAAKPLLDLLHWKQQWEQILSSQRFVLLERYHLNLFSSLSFFVGSVWIVCFWFLFFGSFYCLFFLVHRAFFF